MAVFNLNSKNNFKDRTLASDLFWGNGGNDTLKGVGGADTIDGGIGNDGLDGGEANDPRIGGAGRDALSGQIGNDNSTKAPATIRSARSETGTTTSMAAQAPTP